MIRIDTRRHRRLLVGACCALAACSTPPDADNAAQTSAWQAWSGHIAEPGATGAANTTPVSQPGTGDDAPGADLGSPSDLAESDRRLVVIHADTCALKSGGFTACATSKVAPLYRVNGLRGFNGAPVPDVVGDKLPDPVAAVRPAAPLFVRLPTGHDCRATLPGLFTKAAPTVDDAEDPANFAFAPLDKHIAAVRALKAVVLWTTGLSLGTGNPNKGANGACAYKDGRSAGPKPSEHAVFARAVRTVARYYNRLLPQQSAALAECKAGAPLPKPFYCRANIYNIEFGRDPTGPGGFVRNDSGKAAWLAMYDAWSDELRKEFPWPENTVSLLAPSIVLDKAALDAAKPSLEAQWLRAFIDHLSKAKTALQSISVELRADSPSQALALAAWVRAYIDKRKLVNTTDGRVWLFVTDLVAAPSAVPAALADDPVRRSTWLGAFHMAVRSLWQRVVDGATLGHAMRRPTIDPTTADPAKLQSTALDSDFVWFAGDPELIGKPRPAAWAARLFGNEIMGGGCNALDMWPGTTDEDHPVEAARAQSMVKSESDAALIVPLAVKLNCVDDKGAATTCPSATLLKNAGLSKDASQAPKTEGRTRAVRFSIADLDYDNAAAKTQKHGLTVRIRGLPADVEDVLVLRARQPAGRPTFGAHAFEYQATFPVTDGVADIPVVVTVPSMHYGVVLY